MERRELERLIAYDSAWFAARSYARAQGKEQEFEEHNAGLETEKVPGLEMLGAEGQPNVNPKQRKQNNKHNK